MTATLQRPLPVLERSLLRLNFMREAAELCAEEAATYSIRQAHAARLSLAVVRQAVDAMNEERVERMWDDLRSR